MDALDHPSIVGLLDEGSDQGTGLLWLAMPLVRGGSLRNLINDSRALPEGLRSRVVEGRLIPAFL